VTRKYVYQFDIEDSVQQNWKWITVTESYRKEKRTLADFT
jgi:hypothetical protein